MAAGKGQRWGLIALVVLAVLIVGGIVGFRVAVGVLAAALVVNLEQALISRAAGPRHEAEERRRAREHEHAVESMLRCAVGHHESPMLVSSRSPRAVELPSGQYARVTPHSDFARSQALFNSRFRIAEYGRVGGDSSGVFLM